MNQDKNNTIPTSVGKFNLKTEFFMQFYPVQPPIRRNVIFYFFKENLSLALKKLFLIHFQIKNQAVLPFVFDTFKHNFILWKRRSLYDQNH